MKQLKTPLQINYIKTDIKMVIQNIEYFRLDLPLAEPYTIAYETVSSTVNIILKLTTNTGLTGWGCAVPDKEVTGETPEEVIDNIEQYIYGLLKGQSPFQISKINYLLKKHLTGSSSSIAMVNIALYDLLARKANLPLYQLLGGYRHSIATSITIGISPLDQTLSQAKYYCKKGYKILKLKGGLDVESDIEKVLKIREQLGKRIKIRFDANQGYTVEESIGFINKTKTANIEIFEQPSKKNKEETLGEITHSVEVPVMADESLKTLKDAFRLASNKRIDMVNIKLMKVGGILESQHINSVAKSAGLEVMVGCIDECALGISAGLHFALSSPNIEFADLDGHLDLIDDPFDGIFKLQKGVLYPSKHNGLGIVNF